MKHYRMIIAAGIMMLSLLAGCSRRDMPMETTPSTTIPVATAPDTEATHNTTLPTQVPATQETGAEIPGESVEQSGTTPDSSDLNRQRRIPARG